MSQDYKRYTKDESTGAIVFHDADAYSLRKKHIASKKLAKVAETSNKKVINTLRNEIKELKDLVATIIEDKG
jgi:hypothetical protein